MLENDHSLKYNVGDIISVTIKPDDQLQYFGKPKRFNSFYELYCQKITRVFPVEHYDYWFRIELSEPINDISGQGSRLHLHGIVTFKSKISVFKFLLNGMTEMLSHALLKINHIQTSEMMIGWKTYCIKQIAYLPKNGYISNMSSETGDEFVDSIAITE